MDSGNNNRRFKHDCIFIYTDVVKMKNNFFESKYFIWCLIVIFGLVLISLGRESYRYFQTSEEIINLEKKINDFKKENEELFRIKETFNSQEFLEDEARRKLNMVKEGESVIIVAESNEPFLNELKVQTKTMSNLKLWLKYFFEK
ncbi:MAG TPA: septum formation initiator family protein [Candidatus Portnoybacteria bacterium]|nr:septum formation initiator family protein [Candidatus Portnoybacteria bacterium]MDD5752263.1 septum formation initiator family protein [Candidatus Portnoybacteria bacterium]HNU96838.1 septum formation initiator family protein [Candidatus Portnoybacteria bacterium]HOZ16544.1 septum formation initiator family protein [Candidatus Portnoybacteria bacterium]HPH52303.1 septum formation initiator family protein [Candidatus Portnoybacteria bacterium]